MTRDLNDSLDDIFGAPSGEVRTSPVRQNAVAYATAEQRFEETCPKCRGTGKFVTYTGRTLGDCFACKGAGKRTFKNSATDRAKTREQAADRKQARQQADMQAWVDANPEAHAWLVKTATRWDMAAKLLGAVAQYGELTERQMQVVTDGIARDASYALQRADRTASAPTLDVSAIEDAFASARAKAERKGQMGVMVKPIKLASGPAKTDTVVRVAPGSVGSIWEGQIFFKSGDGERKLGYVKGGKFIRQFACTDVEAEAIVKVAATPKESLLAYAKAWSKCGVCNRGLLKDESIERGIGPICFAKLGF